MLALTVTVVVISAMIFVACKGRYIFIVPGMGFLLFAVTAVVFLSRFGRYTVDRTILSLENM